MRHNDYDDCCPASPREVMLAIVVALGGLVALGMMDDRDARIAKLEAENAAFSGCMPQRDNEIAAIARRGDKIECAVSTGKSGNKQTFRYEYSGAVAL